MSMIKLTGKQLRSLIESAFTEDLYKTIPAPRPDSANFMGGNYKGDLSKVKNWHKHAAQQAIDGLDAVIEVLKDPDAAHAVLQQLRDLLKS